MSQLPGSARVNQYTASAGQTTFTYDFKIYDDDEITVQQNSTTLTLTTHYTVTGAGGATGGTIVLVTGATVDDTITLTGNTMVERETTFTNGGRFAADAINGEYNKILYLLSENLTDIKKAVNLAVYSPTFNSDIPSPVADKAIKVNSAGTGFEMSTYDPDECQGSAAAAAASASAAAGSASTAGTARDEAVAAAASIDLDDIGSDIIPDATNTRVLGTDAKRWKEIKGVDLSISGDLTVSTDKFTVAGATGDLIVNTDKFTVAGTTGNTVIDGTLSVGGAPVTGNATAIIRHQVAYYVNGGGSSSAVWLTRPLDTLVHNDINLSLSSNVITMPGGTYICQGWSTHKNSSWTKVRLYDTDNSTILAEGAFTIVTGRIEQVPFSGKFSLAGETDVVLQYYCSNSLATSGLGQGSAISTMGDNIFADILIQKVG